MHISLVFVTHNRLEYTRLALASLLADVVEEFSLTLWDNGSTDGTRDYLRDGVKDPRIVEVVLNKENTGQTGAMNYTWSKSKAELVGKVDNDCLVTPGWTRTIAQAHKDVVRFGAVACWHFFPEDFDYKDAKHKIQTFNGHQIFRHPWVCGSGFILKRETFLRQGLWKKGANVGTTHYFLKMALAGYINGWYYPLVYQEHMDDPKSSYCMIKDEESFCKYQNITYGLKQRRYSDIAGRLERRREIVRNLLDDPCDPRYYVGWRSRLTRLKGRMRKLIAGSASKKPN
jgi:glycosyltransferase involved in cell wall biosynthesis